MAFHNFCICPGGARLRRRMSWAVEAFSCAPVCALHLLGADGLFGLFLMNRVTVCALYMHTLLTTRALLHTWFSCM